MATSGRPVEITFTPAVAGQLIVTANFNAEGSGADWGSGAIAKCFCEQSSTTTYDGESKLGAARGSYTLIGRFDVAAGAAVKCGVYGAVTGATSRSFYDVFVRAELVKK